METKAKKQEERHNEKNRTTNGEPIKEIVVDGLEQVKPKKQQKVSISYTLKSFKGNNDKLFKAKVINSEMYDTLEKLRTEATRKHIESEYGL